MLELSFDPLLSVGGINLRWDALALVAVLLFGLLVWVLRLRDVLGPALRFDDVCFVLLGAIPGAVVGGRLVHVLDYADVYLVKPLTVLDLGRGSASLVGAAIGGALSAAYICRLLGGKVGVWADAASIPMLMVIGLGKLALMLGGGGQGAATGGQLAVAYIGGGPWRSIDAAAPAYPSQVLEGAWALLGIPVVLVVEHLVRARGRARSRHLAPVRTLLVAGWPRRRRAHMAGSITWWAPWVPRVSPRPWSWVAIVVSMAIDWRVPVRTPAAHPTVPVGPGPSGTGGR